MSLGTWLVVLLTGCGGGSAVDSIDAVDSSLTTATTPASTTTSLIPEPAPAAKLRLTTPAAWLSNGEGTVVAETADDLTGDTPQSYRIVDVSSEEMSGFVPEHDIEVTELTQGPSELNVAGYPAVSLTLTEQMPSGSAFATTTLVVNTGEGTAQVFLLQAPGEFSPETEATLLATIQPVN
jgi:hypothetical protein